MTFIVYVVASINQGTVTRYKTVINLSPTSSAAARRMYCKKCHNARKMASAACYESLNHVQYNVQECLILPLSVIEFFFYYVSQCLKKEL